MTISSTTPALMHKSLGVAGCKVLDAEHGIVEAYVSGIGNKDSGGDIIIPGAFDAHLPRRKPKGVWSHDWDKPVSKTLEIYEVSAGDPRLPMKMQINNIGGLYVKTQFNMNTQLGKDAYETVRFYGDEAEWSIGYQVHDQEFDRKSGAMVLKEIELYEYSPVLFGMNELTSTVSIKVHQLEGGGLEYDVKGLNELETKAVSAALKVILEEKQMTIDVDEKTDAPEGGEDMSDSHEETSAKTDETEVESKEEEVEEVEEKTDDVEADEKSDDTEEVEEKADEPEVEAKEEEETVEEKTEEDSDIEEKADDDVLLDTLVAKISRSVLEKIVDDLQSVLTKDDEKSEEPEADEKADEPVEEAKEDDSEVEAKDEEADVEAKEDDDEVDEKEAEEEVEEKTDTEDAVEDADEKSEEAEEDADEKSDEDAEEKADEETDEKADEEVEAKEDDADEDSEEKADEVEDSDEKSDEVSDAEFLRGLAEFDALLSDEL